MNNRTTAETFPRVKSRRDRFVIDGLISCESAAEVWLISEVKGGSAYQSCILCIRQDRRIG